MQVVVDWWLFRVIHITLGSPVHPFSEQQLLALGSLHSTMFLCQNNIPNKDVICALYLDPDLFLCPVYSKCIIPQMETFSLFHLWHWHKPLNSQLKGIISSNFPPALIAQKLYPPLTNTNTRENKINSQEAGCPG